LGEFFAVRTAWHGPGDVSPVGHAANVHLDLAVANFGIQEATPFNQALEDVFPGCPAQSDLSVTVALGHCLAESCPI
jgi:mannonate dehydratase